MMRKPEAAYAQAWKQQTSRQQSRSINWKEGGPVVGPDLVMGLELEENEASHVEEDKPKWHLVFSQHGAVSPSIWRFHATLSSEMLIFR